MPTPRPGPIRSKSSCYPPRNHRSKTNPDGHAGIRQNLDRIQPSLRRRGAWLHRTGQSSIEGRDRDEGRRQPLARHRPQDVQVPSDQGGLGDDADRLVESGRHFQHATRDLQVALIRLIGVGIAAYVDSFPDVFFGAEFLFQETRGVGLEENPALEIQARG